MEITMSDRFKIVGGREISTCIHRVATQIDKRIKARCKCANDNGLIRTKEAWTEINGGNRLWSVSAGELDGGCLVCRQNEKSNVTMATVRQYSMRG